MTDYQTTLLEYIAWKLTSGPQEFAEFRKSMEEKYAGASQSSPEPIIRSDRGGIGEKARIFGPRGKK